MANIGTTADLHRGRLRAVLDLPRGKQLQALEQLVAALPQQERREEWDQGSGPGSLNAAWAQSTLGRGLWQANAQRIRSLLEERQNWRIVVLGEGSEFFWHGLFTPSDRGELHVIDPTGEAQRIIAPELPTEVHLHSVPLLLESAELPEADVLVCGRVLQGIAGCDAEERKSVGLSGPGKLECLQKLARALVPRQGYGLLYEPDFYTDVRLHPEEELLTEQLVDGYVRRFALALMDDSRRSSDDSLAVRLWALVRYLCLDQLAIAYAPVKDRGVYGLDVMSWLSLLKRANIEVIQHLYTDDYFFFHQYIFTVR
jgi:hypothetical protein